MQEYFPLQLKNLLQFHKIAIPGECNKVNHTHVQRKPKIYNFWKSIY